MSYARFGEDSNVYVYLIDDGWLTCSSRHDEDFYAESTAEMVEHLEAHKAAGDLVPDDVIPTLWRDDAENFPAATP